MKFAYRSVLLAMAVSVSLLSCAEFSSYKYRMIYRMNRPVENLDRYYRDNAVSFRFEIKEKKIEVTIRNEGEEPITLLWPQVRYIDPAGRRHPIANAQTVFTRDPDRVKEATLAPGKTDDNMIVPAKNMEKIEQWTWVLEPLFDQEDEKALMNKDKLFGIDFPLNIGEETRNYAFRFSVFSVMEYSAHIPR